MLILFAHVTCLTSYVTELLTPSAWMHSLNVKTRPKY